MCSEYTIRNGDSTATKMGTLLTLLTLLKLLPPLPLLSLLLLLTQWRIIYKYFTSVGNPKKDQNVESFETSKSLFQALQPKFTTFQSHIFTRSQILSPEYQSRHKILILLKEIFIDW